MKEQNMMTFMKVAWVREPEPPGRPAMGRLSCRCGNAPLSDYNSDNGNVTCACGAVYTWNGWIVKPEPRRADRGAQ